MKLNKFLAIPIFIAVQLIAMDEPFQCKVPRHDGAQLTIENEDDTIKEPITSKVKRYTIAGIKDVALAYGVWWINLLSHEFGHALMAKLLVNPKIDIFAGPHDKPALFSVGNLHVTSFFPQEGYCRCHFRTTPWRVIAICAAGPIAGVATAWYCYKKLLDKYPRGEYPLSKFCALVWSGVNGVALYPSGNSDGAQIKNAYQVYKKNRLAVAKAGISQ